MPDDSGGNFSLPGGYLAVTGQDILPSNHNPPLEQIATALSARFSADGRKPAAGNWSMATFRITNVGNAVNPQDAATLAQLEAQAVPIGAMMDYAGTTAPTNFMLCYGQAVSRTTYATLFSRLGTAWGAGDGSTTFNLPDMRGRARVGKDNMGGTAANRVTTAGSGVDGLTLGATGGAQSHTLDVNQIPTHAHGASSVSAGAHTHTGTAATAGAHNHASFTDPAGGHTHTGTTSASGDHQHQYTAAATLTPPSGTGALQALAAASPGSFTSAAGNHTHTLSVDAVGGHQHVMSMAFAGDHTHSVTTVSAGAHTHAITVDPYGGGGAHNNMQPSGVCNVIIRVQ